jgi:Txe/YoeB family toxin of Txe-Axe toxin-antitoxin module
MAKQYRFWETKSALTDKIKIKSMSKSAKAKFKYFVEDILDNPRNLDTVGNPEELKHRRHETYSRELNKKTALYMKCAKG